MLKIAIVLLIALFSSPALGTDPRKVWKAAKTVRRLVYENNWAAAGMISFDKKTFGYPMVNSVAITDRNANFTSSGRIRFLIMDEYLFGRDWRYNNKTTFFFTDEQHKGCSKRGINAMSPRCTRVMITGHVRPIPKTGYHRYDEEFRIFSRRHIDTKTWLKAHDFHLCELDITNIYLLNGTGGLKPVPVNIYYKAHPDL